MINDLKVQPESEHHRIAAVLRASCRDLTYSMKHVMCVGMMRTPIVVDGRRVLDHNKVEAAGLIYRCVGRGMKPDQDTGVQE
jgi:hypothetical protein